MTLRLRLFALLVALAALLAVGEWVLVRSLSAELEEELAAAAASVSEDILRLMRFDVPLRGQAAGGGKAGEGEHVARRVFIVRDHDVVTDKTTGGAEANGPTAKPGPAAPPPELRTTRPLPPLSDDLPPPAKGEAQGIVEVRAVAPDGTVTTQRREVRAMLDPSSPAHVLLFHGGDAAERVPVPTSGVEHAVERFARRLLLASLALFGGAMLLGVVVMHRFTRPLRDLASAARRVGGGELGVRAPAAPGEVGEAVTAFNQMSERLRALDAETERLRASEQLSELGEVGRGLAHSLRNPLNALGLALDQLAEQAEPDGAATAEAARRQIRRIDGALRGFLALSAGDAAASEVDLTAVARDVALEALQSRPNGGEAPRVEVVAPAQPVCLRGVEAELRAAVQALVVNAVEASPAGQSVVVTVGGNRHCEERKRRSNLDAARAAGACQIEIATAAAPPRDDKTSLSDAGGGAGIAAAVTITVDDRGLGIPPSIRERLFTPHVTTKAAGAGVGLYLAHRLATTRYGGTLTVEDREGGGTRATLLLCDRGAGASSATVVARATTSSSSSADGTQSNGAPDAR